MSDRTPFSDQTRQGGIFSELMVERFRSDKQLAQDHVVGRNRRVGFLLCYLSLMQGHGLIPAKTKVLCRGAKYQDFHAEAGKEAAHYMPGHLYLEIPQVGLREPTDLLSNASTREALGELFSRVHDLPADFNKADSYAEKYARPALKSLLQDICQTVIDKPGHSKGRCAAAVVHEAYDAWIAKSLQAYSYAINRKIDIAELDENPLPPGTRPEMLENGLWEPHSYNPARAALYERAVRKNRSGEATATVWDYSEQIRILAYYVEFSQGSRLTGAIIQTAENTFKHA